MTDGNPAGMGHDLRELYQELILDHNRSPRNYGPLPSATHQAEGFNPLCGDRMRLFLKVRDEVIEGIGFEGQGCAISKASTSLMTEAVKGKTKGQALRLFEGFRGLVTGEGAVPTRTDTLGKLMVFSNIHEFPARVKCAVLAWHTLKAALEKTQAAVSTE